MYSYETAAVFSCFVFSTTEQLIVSANKSTEQHRRTGMKVDRIDINKVAIKT